MIFLLTAKHNNLQSLLSFKKLLLSDGALMKECWASSKEIPLTSVSATRLKPLARIEVPSSLLWTNQHHAYLALKLANLNQKEADSHQHK